MSELAVQKIFKFGKGSRGHCRNGDFLIFKIETVRYLGFEKLTFSSVVWVQSAPTRHPAKLCCNSFNGC